MFRYKRGIRVPYLRQGYIYFTSRLYEELPERDRARIDALCRRHGGRNWMALRDYVTTDVSATEIEMRYFISRSTLYRIVRRYYEGFPRKL